VREVLSPLIKDKVLAMDERLLQAFLETEAPPGKSAGDSSEDKRARGWHALFKAPWAEVGRYRLYAEGSSNLATHQVVKGSEFKHVMVVMDDEEAGGFLFSYDKVFGGAPLSEKDHENAATQKETTIDRTLRLLYVTCSRAQETLALVLWSKDPDAALQAIKGSGWFLDDEMHAVPEA
jgi:DNA helicase-2/ATP-dependent DNA helicase PcrA